MKKLEKYLNDLGLKFGHAFEGIYVNRSIMNFELREKINSLELKIYELDTLIIIY